MLSYDEFRKLWQLLACFRADSSIYISADDFKAISLVLARIEKILEDF